MSWSVAPGYEEDFSKVIVTTIDITDRKRSEKKIEQHLGRLTALREIDQAITSTFDVQMSLEILLTRASEILIVDAASVLLLDPVRSALKYAAWTGFRTTTIQGASVELGKSLAGKVAFEQQIVQIPGLVDQSDDLLRTGFLKGEEFVSYQGAPLIVKGKVLGVLEVYSRSYIERDSDWLDFFSTLAGQAALAIDNAQLFKNLQRSNAEPELRVAERTAELRLANIELEHANRAKDEFLANMSDELRMPLNSILGLSEALIERARGPLNERQEQALQVIASSGTHLLGLINDILDVSKIEAGKLDIYQDIVAIQELCRSSLNFVRELALKKSITLEFQADPSISTLFADPQRVKQILVNLLSNAVKLTPERGQVTLEVSTNTERDQISFAVIDTRIGIAVEDLKKLFKPFVQLNSSLARQNQGTGLGLTIAFTLTELHGGSIQVDSQLGQGSRFTVVLPWNPTAKSAIDTERAHMEKSVESAPAPKPDSAQRAKILLAEDHEANRLMLSEYLQDQGFEAIRAGNGHEALAKAAETLPDLILMDIQMPEVDGLEAIRRLREIPRFASTPIIALTALAMPGDRERCLEAGATEYMSKP